MLSPLMLPNPERLEGGERRKDAAADPRGKSAFDWEWERDQFQFDVCRSQLPHFGLKLIRQAANERVPTSYYHVSVQLLLDVDVALVNVVVNHMVKPLEIGI